MEQRPTERLALRVSDEERERAVARLKEHHLAGRLSHDELEERVQAAFSARTAGELETVLRQLPARSPVTLPTFRHHLALYLAVNVGLVVVWLLTSHPGPVGPGYFWPVWVILSWGIVLVLQATRPRRRP